MTLKMERRRSSKLFRKQENIETMSSLSFSSKQNGVEVKDVPPEAASKPSSSGGKSIKAMWKRFAFKAAKTKTNESLPTSNNSTQNTSEDSQGQMNDAPTIDRDDNADLHKASMNGIKPRVNGKHMMVRRMKSSSLDVDDKSRLQTSTKFKSLSYTHTNMLRLPGDSSSSPTRRRLQMLQQNRGWSADVDEHTGQAEREEADEEYVILYDFYKREPGDLPLRAGDRVKVKEKVHTGWWLAECNGDMGYFPARYALPLNRRQSVLQVIQPFHCNINDIEIRLLKDQVVLQCGSEDEQGMITVETDNIQTGTVQRVQCPLACFRRI